MKAGNLEVFPTHFQIFSYKKDSVSPPIHTSTCTHFLLFTNSKLLFFPDNFQSSSEIIWAPCPITFKRQIFLHTWGFQKVWINFHVVMGDIVWLLLSSTLGYFSARVISSLMSSYCIRVPYFHVLLPPVVASIFHHGIFGFYKYAC